MYMGSIHFFVLSPFTGVSKGLGRTLNMNCRRQKKEVCPEQYLPTLHNGKCNGAEVKLYLKNYFSCICPAHTTRSQSFARIL